MDNFDRDYVYEGDARRCPKHPHVKTSSADGMHDGLCGECEYEMDQAAAEEDLLSLGITPEVRKANGLL
jgi:hypothetical protein